MAKGVIHLELAAVPDGYELTATYNGYVYRLWKGGRNSWAEGLEAKHEARIAGRAALLAAYGTTTPRLLTLERRLLWREHVEAQAKQQQEQAQRQQSRLRLPWQ